MDIARVNDTDMDKDMEGYKVNNGDVVSSDDDDSSEVGVVNGGTDSSSTSGHNGVNGVNKDDDDTDTEEGECEVDDKVTKGVNGVGVNQVGKFKNDGEPAFKLTKVKF